MDDIVKQALAKWPNVPDCYGWLGLDARGNWYMRDDPAQAAGPFSGGTLQSKGSMLKHEKLIDFIQRNYESDAAGRWFFQNGPQKVYVELEATPWIWRISQDAKSGQDSDATHGFSVAAHDGRAAQVQSCVLDEQGRVYLQTDIGFGLVHTQDVALAADAVEAGVWVPQDMLASDLPQRFGYVTSPQQQYGAKHVTT
jgi:Protein of unknown function (DUF2946)